MSRMLSLIHFVLFYILATLSGVQSLRQVIHDESFQPDFILRVSSKEAPIACRTRLTAVVNGTLRFSSSLCDIGDAKYWWALIGAEKVQRQGRRYTCKRIAQHGSECIMILNHQIWRWYGWPVPGIQEDNSWLSFIQHWHGLAQSVSPFSDGTPQASQWPIKVSHLWVLKWVNSTEGKGYWLSSNRPGTSSTMKLGLS